MSGFDFDESLGVNPSILKWAREQAGLSLAEAAHRAKLTGLKARGKQNEVDAPTRLHLLEQGQLSASWAQLENIAKAYRRPLLTFFLSDPPIDPEVLPDFRHGQSGYEARMSPEFSEYYTFLIALQDAVRDILEANGEKEIDFIGSLALGAPVRTSVMNIRDILQFNFSDQRKIRDSDGLFSAIRKKIHSVGVFVVVGNGLNMKRPVDSDEFRGMAICDKLAPFIVVNSSDVKAGQVFTLLHEFVHLLLGQNALSNFNAFSLPVIPVDSVEKYSDELAAEFLVPKDELDLELKERKQLDWADMVALAKIFKVSRAVIVRRSYESGYLAKELYSEWMGKLAAEWRIRKQRQREQDNKPGWVQLVRSRIGEKVIRTLAEGVGEGFLTARDASAVLRIRQDNFWKLVR